MATCSKCSYATNWVIDGDQALGECRRYPPSRLDGRHAGSYTMVNYDMTCGEHKPKEVTNGKNK